ncbi:MAG: lipopolysaccharide biosynthesis protein [Deltaproteobacteria bacterium]|nr:lipopolysaccharide biosynthesis protein [Deltaproteobacteria bacterium]
MELLEFLRLIGRYRTTIALMCASAALTALALTYVLTERYSASALVLVRPQEEMRLVGSGSDKETLDFPLPQVVPFEAMTRTFGEVIRSAAVVEPVVLRLGLDQPTVETVWWKRLKTWTKNRLSDAWALLKYGRIEEQDPTEAAVETVQNFLTVEPTKDTYVFEIAYLGTDPGVAAAVVNAAAEVFVEYNWQLYRAEKSKGREFVGEQLTESEAALARAREPLRMFKERNQSVLLERELAAKVEALANRRAELGRTDADIASATARLAELRRSLRPAPSVVMTAEIQDQITEQLLATEAELRGLQAKRESLAGSIEASGAELGSLPPEQLEHSRLLADVKVAESTHEFVKKSYDEARIREAESVPEIRVVSPAIAPVYPERPIKILYVGTAFGMALAVGIALAIVLEYLDQTLRTTDDAERALGLPLLATIPPLEP